MNGENLVSTLVGTWEEAKEYLKNNTKKSIQEIISENVFFQAFDSMFQNSLDNLEYRRVQYSTPFYRGCGINEIIPFDNYSRMIPKKEFIKDHNRMSPPNKAYIYLAPNVYNFESKKNQILTIVKELRLNPLDYITVCRFNPLDNLKIIDLRSYDDVSLDTQELLNRLTEEIKKSKSVKQSAIKDNVTEYLVKYYLKIFNNEQIFKPVNRDTDDVEFEYAPFQFLAKYFEEKGYDGILYSSTVYTSGSNMVIFYPEKLEIDPTSFERVTLIENESIKFNS